MTNTVRWAVFLVATAAAIFAGFLVFRNATDVDLRPWCAAAMVAGIVVAASVFDWPFSGPAT